MKVTTFRNVTPCCPVKVYQTFEDYTDAFFDANMAYRLINSLFNSEDGDCASFRNVVKFLPDYTVLYQRRHIFSETKQLEISTQNIRSV
jgi:hypothetical protein